MSKTSAFQDQHVEGIVYERAEELDGYTDGVIMKNLQAASEQA